MAMAFTPVRQAGVSGEIVSQIEKAIFAGVLSSGDRLESECEVAKNSMSRGHGGERSARSHSPCVPPAHPDDAPPTPGTDR